MKKIFYSIIIGLLLIISYKFYVAYSEYKVMNTDCYENLFDINVNKYNLLNIHNDLEQSILNKDFRFKQSPLLVDIRNTKAT